MYFFTYFRFFFLKKRIFFKKNRFHFHFHSFMSFHQMAAPLNGGRKRQNTPKINVPHPNSTTHHPTTKPESTRGEPHWARVSMPRMPMMWRSRVVEGRLCSLGPCRCTTVGGYNADVSAVVVREALCVYAAWALWIVRFFFHFSFLIIISIILFFHFHHFMRSKNEKKQLTPFFMLFRFTRSKRRKVEIVSCRAVQHLTKVQNGNK